MATTTTRTKKNRERRKSRCALTTAVTPDAAAAAAAAGLPVALPSSSAVSWPRASSRATAPGASRTPPVAGPAAGPLPRCPD